MLENNDERLRGREADVGFMLGERVGRMSHAILRVGGVQSARLPVARATWVEHTFRRGRTVL